MVPVDVKVTKEAEEDNELRHSLRERRGVPPLRFTEMYLAGDTEEEVKQSPLLVEEALNSSQRDERQEAMDSESSPKEKRVYELVDKPQGEKVVKSKWVLRVKTNEKGGVEGSGKGIQSST